MATKPKPERHETQGTFWDFYLPITPRPRRTKPKPRPRPRSQAKRKRL